MKSTWQIITVLTIIISAIIACVVIFCFLFLRKADFTFLVPYRLPVALLVIAAGLTLGWPLGILAGVGTIRNPIE